MTDGNCHWVKQVQRGARLLFWVVLVSALLTSTGSTAVAVLGGTRSDLRWVEFVPTLAELLLLVGVYRVTAPIPCPKDLRAPDTSRQALRACAVLAVFGQLGRLLARHIQTWAPMPYVWTGERFVESVAIFLLFLYLSRLAARFEETRLSWSLALVAWLAAIGNLLFIFSLERMYENLVVSLSTYQALLWSRAFLHLVIWIWALRVLWEFGSTVPVAAEGRCINCGYPHEGLTEARCPECGLAF